MQINALCNRDAYAFILGLGTHRFLTKTMRVMQLSAIFLTVCCLSVTARTVSQSVTYKGTNAELKTVFKAIEKQTGYFLLFDDELVNNAKAVSIDAQEMPLSEFLSKILSNQSLTYSILNTTITIERIPAAGLSPRLDLDAPPITGIVRGPDGKPLAGINIVVKNANKGVVTDGNGQFSIDAEPGSSLLISSIGYSQQEIRISANQSYLNISMAIATSPLDEIQVIAYGTNSRRLSTGNVTTVSSKEIETQPISNPLSALQGRVPGMVITQNTGVSGGGFSVQIRGRNSIKYGTDPLYIVDGVPYPSSLLTGRGSPILTGSFAGSPLAFLNPLDIASISVLKDADATAIYGSRGANGVVLITTKKGKSGKLKLDLNAATGVRTAVSKMKYLNTPEYLKLRKEGILNDGIPEDMIHDADLTIWDSTAYTDWQDKMIGNTGRYTSIQSSLSGGSENTQFLVSGTYLKETSVFPGEFYNQKGNLHLNLNTYSQDRKFNMLFSSSYMLDENKQPPVDFTEYSKIAPNAPEPFNEDGSLNWANNTFNNPYAQTRQKFQVNTKNLVSNLALLYKLPLGFEIKTSMGYTNMQLKELNLTPIISLNPFVPFTQTGQAFFTNNNINSWIIEPQLNYKKDIDKIRIDATLGSTFQQSRSTGQIEWGSGYVSDALLTNPQAAPSFMVVSVTDNLYKYTAGFARVSFNYADKYLLNLTGRRDGSSRFGTANRFHGFGSVGAGWIFTEESFIRNNLKFLSFGKLRASFGTTGSDQINDYIYYDLFSTAQFTYQGSSTLTPAGFSNPYIAWEETRKFEAGLDLAILKDRLLFNIAYYRNRSSNQLSDIAVPQQTGFGTITTNFPARIENLGWEFQFNLSNFGSRAIKWNSSINLTIARNKLMDFPDIDQTIYQYTMVVGQPLSIQKVFHMVGVNDTTGLYEFADFKGATTSTPQPLVDNTTLISLIPEYYGGFSNTLTYKNFELNILFQFVRQIGISPLFQATIAPGMHGTSALTNVSEENLERWQLPGDITSIQRSTYGTAYGSYISATGSDAAYTDASFVRLKNVNISYQLAGNLVRKLKLQGVRFNVTAQNLLTITKYKGIDPETQLNGRLPPLRIVTAGIQLSL